MNLSHLRFVVISLVLVAFVSTGAVALTIASDAPGNIFPAGSAALLSASDVHGDLQYTLVDYYGHTAAEGKSPSQNGIATISIQGLKLGWYELNCRDDAGTASTTLGVIIDRGNTPLPYNGRVGAVSSSDLLLHNESYRKPYARMLRMAGISWVSEQLWWNPIEPERGKLDWGKYQTVADTLAAEGIHIYRVWHDAPGWTQLQRYKQYYTLCPDDLRDVYQFMKTASSHFAPQVSAWEVWNEPASSFFGDLSDRFGGLQKAAYFGIKDGNPKAMVLQTSFVADTNLAFQDSIYEFGAAEYSDIFNWHRYCQPEYHSMSNLYSLSIKPFNDILKKYHAQNRPAWMTEAGILLRGREPDRFLLPEELHKQCRFMPQSVATALAVGNDKYFFFVLPNYSEDQLQFGILYPDMTPRPAFIALSAAANILGESEYLGEYKSNPKVTSHIFSTPKGKVMVAWADKDSDLSIPTEKPFIRVANMFGDTTQLKADNGTVQVKIGQDPVYLLDIGDILSKRLKLAPATPHKLPVNKPSRIVIAGHCDLPVDKNGDYYQLGATSSDLSFNYTVETYNFSENASASGVIKVNPPPKWKIDKTEQTVQLGPMDRKVLTFKITANPSGLGVQRLNVRAKFGKEKVWPSASSFRPNALVLTPTRRKALDWTNAAAWIPSCASHGTVTVTNPAQGIVRFETLFKGVGDRWVYPVFHFDKPQDFTGFDGIAFDLTSDQDGTIFMMFLEPNGATYMTGMSVHPGKKHMLLLFRDMGWLPITPKDANNHFNLEKIAEIKLGTHTPQIQITYSAENFELVKFN
jgi:hypothetical protein